MGNAPKKGVLKSQKENSSLCQCKSSTVCLYALTMDGRYLKTIIHQIGFGAKLKGFTIFSGISAAENKGFVAEGGFRVQDLFVELQLAIRHNCRRSCAIIKIHVKSRPQPALDLRGAAPRLDGRRVLGEKVGGVGRVSGAWWPARCCISSAAAPTIRRSRPELQQ